MMQSRPSRTLGGPHDTFWEFCENRELRMQRCQACQEYQWPPVESCRSCGGSPLVWTRLSGHGRVRSWCVFQREYHEECPPPWPVLMVELDEGPLFITNPAGSRPLMQDSEPVTVTFIECADAAGRFSLPVFEARSRALEDRERHLSE
jgi:uncharacterized OB-fold protein